MIGNRILRFTGLAVLGVVVLACVTGTIGVLILSPPSGTAGSSIAGVTLNLANGYVVIPPRYMDCTNEPDPSRLETCSVDIAGDTLTVHATHDDINHFTLSDCRATFRDQERFCYGRTETVKTAPYAVFTNLGLSDDEVAGAQRQHFLTSRRSESAWWQLTTNTATVLGITSAAAALGWVRGGFARRLGQTLAVGGSVFLLGLIILRLALYTTAFVD